MNLPDNYETLSSPRPCLDIPPCLPDLDEREKMFLYLRNHDTHNGGLALCWKLSNVRMTPQERKAVGSFLDALEGDLGLTDCMALLEGFKEATDDRFYIEIGGRSGGWLELHRSSSSAPFSLEEEFGDEGHYWSVEPLAELVRMVYHFDRVCEDATEAFIAEALAYAEDVRIEDTVDVIPDETRKAVRALPKLARQFARLNAPEGTVFTEAESIAYLLASYAGHKFDTLLPVLVALDAECRHDPKKRLRASTETDVYYQGGALLYED